MVEKQIINLDEATNFAYVYKLSTFDDNYQFDISVVVCTYNPVIESLKFTLNSIFEQEEVDVEIIVADDGSVEDFHEEIIRFFNQKGFTRWKIICNEVNHGTVYNLYSGLKISNGKYVKVISPGDALLGKHILREWLIFQNQTDCKWSFSDAIYYKKSLNTIKDVVSLAHPNDISPYLKKNRIRCRWNYIVLDDIALGATLFCESNVMIEYVSKILNKVIYAEDNIWRMMMFDGIVGDYFPHNAILYEYGTGISTKGSDIWSKRLLSDWNEANNIMQQDGKLDKFQLAIVDAWEINGGNNKFKKALIKGKLKQYIVTKLRRRKTQKRN